MLVLHNMFATESKTLFVKNITKMPTMFSHGRTNSIRNNFNNNIIQKFKIRTLETIVII